MILQGKNYSEITFIEGENILGSRDKFICSSCLFDRTRKHRKEQILGCQGTWYLVLNIYLLALPSKRPVISGKPLFAFLCISELSFPCWTLGAGNTGSPLSSSEPRPRQTHVQLQPHRLAQLPFVASPQPACLFFSLL